MISHRFNLSPRGILNQCFQLNKFLQNFIFFLDKENPSVLRKIISEGEYIPISIHGCGGNRYFDIRMNHPQYT